jgi:hypothetical protein
MVAEFVLNSSRPPHEKHRVANGKAGEQKDQQTFIYAEEYNRNR